MSQSASDEPTSGPLFEARVRRRQRRDGYLLAAALAPVCGQQAVRAARDRNGWGMAAAAAPLVAGVARTEFLVRQIPAQRRATAEHVRERQAAFRTARERGEDPHAAIQTIDRRHGLSLLPAMASVLVLIGGQLWRLRRAGRGGRTR